MVCLCIWERKKNVAFTIRFKFKPQLWWVCGLEYQVLIFSTCDETNSAQTSQICCTLYMGWCTQSAQYRTWCAIGHHSMSILLSLSLLQLTAASWATLGIPLSPSLDVETQSPQLLLPCCLWQSTQNMEHRNVPKDLKSYEIPSAGSKTRDPATSGMTHGKLLPLLGIISPTLELSHNICLTNGTLNSFEANEMLLYRKLSPVHLRKNVMDLFFP